MKIVFFGNERLASSVQESGVILQSLIDAGHTITHLLINQSHVQSRKKTTDKVVEIANNNAIPVITEWNKDEVISLANQADAGVLAAYGRIIPTDVIEAFKNGIINIHPSLLPLYRGSTPIESAILNGDTQTGVSVMALAKKMDAGDIYSQEAILLTGTETKQELYETLSQLGASKVVELLAQNKPIPASQQDHSLATYCPQIEKGDGVIDWSKSATQLDREIRAYAGWPGSKAIIALKDTTITSASVLNKSGEPGTLTNDGSHIIAFCGDNALTIERLKPAGKAEMSAKDFLNGTSL